MASKLRYFQPDTQNKLMSVQNQKNLIKKLVSLIGVASASVLLSSPALALINSTNFNKSLNHGTLHADSTGKSRQLLAQNVPGTGGTINNVPGTGDTNNNVPGADGTTGVPGAGGTNNNVPGTGRSGQSTNRSMSGNGRSNGSQRTVYTQYMRAGYAATQQKDYQTALTNFKKALSIRPNDSYATKAIQNVQSYIQRSQGNR